jgi:hypothetical protein
MNTQLLIILFGCHFLADYTWLSTSWMLNAKRFGKPFLPILVHAMVHGIIMLSAMLLFDVSVIIAVLLAIFQIVSHCLIDLLKGRANGWFPLLQDNSNKWHWIIFGLDQYLHAIVIIIMVSQLK